MTIDQLLRDAGAHVDALIDRHVASAPTRLAVTPPTTTEHTREHELMTVIEQPPRAGDPVTRPPHRWGVIGVALAAAAAAVLLVVGITLVRRDDDTDTTPADIPADATLSSATRVEDNRIQKVVFDGTNLWSVRTGSTFLVRMNPNNGEVVQSFSLPEAATEGRAVVHLGTLYVPTAHGVVTVDTNTFDISEPEAVGEGAVWSVAFTTDSVWMVRRDVESATLERWSPDLAERLLSVDLGSEGSVGIAGVGDYLYFATENRGLEKYDSTGAVVATVDGIGVAWEMEAAADGTLWIADFFNGDLVAVDTATDTVKARVAISGSDVMSVAVGPSAVLVTAKTTKLLVVVDPTTFRVASTAPLPDEPMELALVKGSVWVSAVGWAERFVPR